MFKVIIVSLLMFLFSVPAFADEIDLAALENEWKEANQYYEQAQQIRKEKGEGGFLQARPYQKEFDEAKNRYQKIIKTLMGRVYLRNQVADKISGVAQGQPQWQGELVEEMLSAELTILPQILYSRAVLTFNDITQDYDLFLPSLTIVPEKNHGKYREGWGAVAVDTVAGGAKVAPEGVNIFSSKTFDQEIYYKILGSPKAQKELVATEQTALQAKISELQSGDLNDAANSYNLGNAYLLEAFYKRLKRCLNNYRKAQSLIPRITYPPRHAELLAFRGKILKIKIRSELPTEVTMENMVQFKEQAAAYLEYAKVPLPKGIDESTDTESFEFARLLEKFRDTITNERKEILAVFKELVTPIYYFNELKVDDEVLSVYQQAVALKKDNVSYHLRLGNLYRIQALSKLTKLQARVNYYHLGFEWNNQPDYKYHPKDENAPVDLAEVKALFDKALAEYQIVEQLSPLVGKRALGIYYLSQISLNPDLALTALENLKAAGEDDLSLLALEYAYCQIDRARREIGYLGFSDDLSDSFNLAVAAYSKIPADSKVKVIAASFLSENFLFQVLSKTNKRITDKGTYSECVTKLNEAKTLDPQNPYIGLLQGYLTFKRGTTLSVQDALSVLMSTFAMFGQHMVMMGDMMLEMQKVDDENYTRDDLEAYADEQGRKMEEQFEKEFGYGNEMIVGKYDVNDFIKAEEIYKEIVENHPSLASAYYYLGRTYSVMGLYYSVQKDQEKAAQYKGLAQDSLKKFLLLSSKK